MAPLLAQVISVDATPLSEWFSGNWQSIAGAGVVAIVDFILSQRQDLRENGIIDVVWNRILRPRLGGKKSQDN